MIKPQRAIVPAIAMLLACSSDAITINATQTNLCSQIAEIACHDIYQCCTESQIESFLTVTQPRTEVQCRADVQKECEVSTATLAYSVSVGRVQFDAQAMNLCLDALLAPSDVCAVVGSGSSLPWTAPCMTSAWVGTTPDGSACLFDHDCGSASSCAPTQLCTPLAGSGDPCGTGCGPGLFCGNGSCAPQLALGSDCEDSDSCLPPLFCDFDQPTAICAAQVSGGMACTDSLQCTSGECVPGACAISGETCFQALDCEGTCSNDVGEDCNQDFECGLGTCSGSDGDGCDVNGNCPPGETCVLPNHCVHQACNGSPVCTADEVVSNYCAVVTGGLPIVQP